MTPVALVPPPMSNPASSGPAIEPTRPTAMLAPDPVPRISLDDPFRTFTVQHTLMAAAKISILDEDLVPSFSDGRQESDHK